MVRTGLLTEIQQTFKKGSMVTRLIYVNLIVFVAVKLVDIVLFLSGADTSLNILVNNMAVPADIGQLAHKPWTLLTYMFLHQQFLHILFNLLWLFWFGKIFTEYLNGRQLLNVYLLGGISGGLLYIAAFNTFPVFETVIPVSVAMGASAGVYAIVVATAVYVPNYTIYLLFLGPVRLKYIALFSILLDVVQLTEGNAGGHIAHLGGAAFGAIYASQIRSGTDISAWLTRLITIVGQWFKPRKKMKITYRRGETDIEFNARKKDEQREIDVILEKIAKSGYESLSKAEKELLFRQSRKN
jgi:membrane associated rhomboid family serine protease